MTRKHVIFLSLAFAVSSLSTPTLSAQTKARLEGVVLDKMGAVISQASLKLFSEERIRETKTDSVGRFQFPDLQPDSYDLQAEYLRFLPGTIEKIQVTDEGVRQVSIILQVASHPYCDRKPTPSYEKRSDKTDLTGNVYDFWGGPVRDAKLQFTSRQSGQTYVTTSKDNGEFQLTGARPGKYTLKVSHNDYVQTSGIDFWITGENLTKLSYIYMVRKDEKRIIICE